MEAKSDLNRVIRSGWAGYLHDLKKPGYVHIYTAGISMKGPSGSGPGGYCALLVAPNGRAMRHIVGSDHETTKRRMQSMAAIVGLEELHECDPGEFCIISDSYYLAESMESRIGKWESRGWKTSNGKPVKDLDLWQHLNALTKHHKIHWLWQGYLLGDPVLPGGLDDETYIVAARNLAVSVVPEVSRDPILREAADEVTRSKSLNVQ